MEVSDKVESGTETESNAGVDAEQLLINCPFDLA